MYPGAAAGDRFHSGAEGRREDCWYYRWHLLAHCDSCLSDMEPHWDGVGKDLDRLADCGNSVYGNRGYL